MNQNFNQASKDYTRIEQAIRFLEENFQEQPSLEVMARHLHMSTFHFQRLFERWAGISPKKFLQYLTKEHAKGLLRKSSVLETSYETGLSGPGRLHDLFVKYEAMTPGEYKQQAKGLVIEYGFHATPLGECFLATTPKGLCALAFITKVQRKEVLAEFKLRWKNAEIRQNQEATAKILQKIFHKQKAKANIDLLCQGTSFQIKVWEALLKIPKGQVVSYQKIARMIGKPKATRAVGNAVGQNPIAYLIPCHRVIREAGHLGGYRWGTARKRLILAGEAVDQCYNLRSYGKNNQRTKSMGQAGAWPS